MKEAMMTAFAESMLLGIDIGDIARGVHHAPLVRAVGEMAEVADLVDGLLEEASEEAGRGAVGVEAGGADERPSTAQGRLPEDEGSAWRDEVA